MQLHSAPRAMTESDVAHAVDEYAQSARLAMTAGFDGVELHGANGYLIEQFLNPNVNRRAAISLPAARSGAPQPLRPRGRARDERRGDRRGGASGSASRPTASSTAPAHSPRSSRSTSRLAAALTSLGLLYLHLVDHSAMGAPPVPADFKRRLRAPSAMFFILAGGFDRATAEAALLEKRGDLIAFGRPMLANPDLVARLRAVRRSTRRIWRPSTRPGPRATRIIRRSGPDDRVPVAGRSVTAGAAATRGPLLLS